MEKKTRPLLWTALAALLLLGGAHGSRIMAAGSPDELGAAAKKASLLMRSAREGRTKGSLGAIRSALSIYYGDHEGRYPADLDELTVDGKYLRRIPTADTAVPGHEPTSSVTVLTDVKDDADLISQVKDTGGWLYVSDPDSEMHGIVVVDCLHADSKGRVWHRY